jgi:DtxR family transcriptional regulator, Mn-dependent transcriptional regulator
MIDPREALTIGVVLLASTALVFWPGTGLLARLRQRRPLPEREAIENALKHLYDCEYKHVDSTVHSLAGALEISGDRATTLIARMESLRLVAIDQDRLRLSAEGRSYALRIIRIHRLWERYLADETGLQETEWHRVAEVREHETTVHEADELSSRLGHPRFDPHGDPIPTEVGELPGQRGVALSDLRGGEAAQIIHLEDEPQTVYVQLVALGLHPGMQVVVTEVEPTRISFLADGTECVLAPSFASAVSVARIAAEQRRNQPLRLLADVAYGDEVVIEGISRACRGQVRRRLMDLGLVPGTSIRAELQSFGGDPIAYLVRDTLVALRRSQAEQIFVRPKGQGDP